MTMSRKDDPDYEPTKFKRKELSSRNSKLSKIIFFSIVSVALGIINVILFSDILDPSIRRQFDNCSAIPNFNLKVDNRTYLYVWASSGIFAITAFVIALIGKATADAWSPQTSAFVYLEPLVAILCLAIAGASAAFGVFTACNYAENITAIADVKTYPKLFYSLIDLLVVILGLVLFFLLLSTWSQILNKRKKSKETKENEKDEKLAKQEMKDKPVPEKPTPSITPVADSTPEKTKSEDASTSKAVPNVYFIQAPTPPAAPAQDQVLPYSPFGNYNQPQYPFSPYGNPYYLPPPPLAPPMFPPPRPPPNRRRPMRPGFRPFRRFDVRVNRGQSMIPY